MQFLKALNYQFVVLKAAVNDCLSASRLYFLADLFIESFADIKIDIFTSVKDLNVYLQ